MATVEQDMDTIRRRIVAHLCQDVQFDPVDQWIAALSEHGTWPDIDYQHDSRADWQPYRHVARLRVMAAAYVSAVSPRRGDPELADSIGRGLDAWFERDLKCPNWWWNAIGIPRTLCKVMLMMDGRLSPEQKAAGLAVLTRGAIQQSGQNRTWRAEITLIRGLVARDADIVRKAADGLAEVVRDDQPEGIQPDRSFRQHGPLLYNHGYGAAFTDSHARLAAMLADTRFAYPARKLALLAEYILDGSRWMTRGRAIDFGADGREIVRKHQDASYLIDASKFMLRLNTGRDDAFRSLIEAVSTDTPTGLQGNCHFWCADFMAHHRQGYYSSVRMHSTRTKSNDGIVNDEGYLTHHLADGCHVVMRTGDEFYDLYPAWDWQKIPGTTVAQVANMGDPVKRSGERAFVGGVSDGTFGVAACDFVRDDLAARKSWFYFDGEIVCLGAGIECPADVPVVTTINQCRQAGSVVVGRNGRPAPCDAPQGSFDGPVWVHQDRIGYVVLGNTTVKLDQRVREGAWRTINRRYPADDVVRERVFTLWLDHGRRVRDGKYAYVVLPDRPVERMPSEPGDLPLEVVANTPTLQAVRHLALDRLGAVFYEAGRLALGDGHAIEVDQPIVLMLARIDRHWTVTVASPDQRETPVRVVMHTAGGGAHAAAIPLPAGRRSGSSVSTRLSPIAP